MIWRSLLILGLASCSGQSRAGHEQADEAGAIQRARAAAVECGLREKDIEVDRTNEGSPSFVIQPSAMDVGYSPFACFLKWGQSNHVQVGFVAEPPPGKQ